jgi:GTP cyclohydrolase I
MIVQLGEDPTREGLRRTPTRVETSLKWLTRGYGLSVEDVIGDALYHETHDNLVCVRDIEIYSLCEHHMLPFFGKAHVAYLPNGRLVGLSKIPRVIEVFARRLQVQERLTDQVADALMRVLEPRGVGSRHRGVPPLHDDARGGEAELQDRHERVAGRPAGRRQDAR